MLKFFELEELHPKDREWTNRGGNGKGKGAVSVSGTYVWTPSDDNGNGDGVVENLEEELASKKAGPSGMAAVAEGSSGQEEGKNEPSDGPEKGEAETPAELWDLRIEGLHIPAGKLTAVVGQVGALLA